MGIREQYKPIAVGCIIVFGLGVLAGKMLIKPPAPKIETVEKIVTKTDIKTVVKEVTRPDGTKETITTRDEHTSKDELDTTKITPDNGFKYKLTPMVGYSISDVKPVYGIMAEKYISKSITLGVYGNTNMEVGISAGINF